MPYPNAIDGVITQPVPNDSILKGIINNTYVKGIVTTSWNARSGGLSKITFKGTEEQLSDLAQQAKDGGYEYSMAAGHIWTLEITVPYDVILDFATGESNPLFIWEMVNNPFEKDILELGDRYFNSNLSKGTVERIRGLLQNPAPGVDPYLPSDGFPGTAAVNATVAYNLKAIGIHGRQSSLQTIRKTMVVSNQFLPTAISTFTLPILDYNVFSTEQWKQYYNNDPNPLNLLPATMEQSMPVSLNVAKWNNDQPPTATLTPVTGWNIDQKGIVTFIGWLQFPCEFQMVSNNKVQITQHWTFNQWSAGAWGLYDPIPINGSGPNPNDVLQLVKP